MRANPPKEKFILNLGDDLKEKDTTSEVSFPCRVGHEFLSNWEQNTFPLHFHAELEFTLILEGVMQFNAGDEVYILGPGSVLMTNTKMLHTGSLALGYEDCRYDVVVINIDNAFPRRRSYIYQQYVKPVLEAPHLPATLLNSNCAQHLQEIIRLYDTSTSEISSALREMSIASEISLLWACIYEQLSSRIKQSESYSTRDRERLNMCISFIENNYASQITLSDIASSANISTSECCHLFGRTIGTTPFSYLLNFRVQQSLPLLTSTNLSIAEVSYKTGFCSNSYYTKIFKERLGMTPLAYRKRLN